MTIIARVKGGPGSGNWGHRGRPGLVGGSGGRGSLRHSVTVAERRLDALGAGSIVAGVVDDPVKTQFPYKDENRKYSVGMGHVEAVVKLPLSWLHSTRPQLSRAGVRKYVADGGKVAQMGRPIRVVKDGDKYYVVDGNHRAMASKLLGFGTIRAEVWSYEPRE